MERSLHSTSLETTHSSTRTQVLTQLANPAKPPSAEHGKQKQPSQGPPARTPVLVSRATRPATAASATTSAFKAPFGKENKRPGGGSTLSALHKTRSGGVEKPSSSSRPPPPPLVRKPLAQLSDNKLTQPFKVCVWAGAAWFVVTG